MAPVHFGGCCAWLRALDEEVQGIAGLEHLCPSFFFPPGTGKTSTLIKYAEKFSNLNFLYVAFNKSIVENGKKVFPHNVTCKTFHSLAFATFGKQ